MTRPLFWLVVALSLAGCGHYLPSRGWTTLIDGNSGLENFNRIGAANWRAEGDAIVADQVGDGFLVSKKSYRDFDLYAEFWAESHTNSGIFLRVRDPREITPFNSYEINIWDSRSDASYGTGAIVTHASVNPMPRAGGKWNVYQIRAQGPQLVVRLNGVVTASIQDGSHAAGPIALQFGTLDNGAPGGAIKWRKLLVREL